MITAEMISNQDELYNSESSDSDSNDILQCQDCNITFTSKPFLYDHLYHHIKQPRVTISRLQLPPLRLTLKNTTGTYEVINSPTSGTVILPYHRDSDDADNLEDEIGHDFALGDDEGNVSFSPTFAEVNLPEAEEGVRIEEIVDDATEGGIPGAEPTPPPEPSPDYPKIRIKTTGLLKEPLTITEITDEVTTKKEWSSTVEDPLKLPGSEDILSLFNNNERAKDFGFTTSDSEFMPLERLDVDNHPASTALQLYNQNQVNPSLNSIAGLPMEALAQQVSRLQPQGNGMHQQNVLINIQQFPQAPPPPPHYHPPNMYHHPPPQPMYPPYPSFQPPNPMFYPPANAYPPQHMPPPPPQPQMPPIGPPPIRQPPVSQPQQTQQYRLPTPRQQGPPRQVPPQRMPVQRQPLNNQRQPMPRQRAPMMRPRGGVVAAVRGGVRPRMVMQPNGVRQQGFKRSPEQIQQALQIKKKRLDVLTPDKDDEDCQVICMQPKNTDGGLPQISSVQGGTPEPAENSVMHLSDSITLSVRNPQPRPQSPKKSDAKAVANILATRGITVTATPKPKDKLEPQKSPQPGIPAQLNLNSAVSIIPSSGKKPPESQLPTVDLTDDVQAKPPNGPSKLPPKQGLPFKCDLCPAQYPNAMSLSKHRQNYHKTNSGMCEIGVPLINLKQPGIFHKLSNLGIFNYIPLPASGPDGTFALPIISGRSPGNVGALGATTMLTLGPVRNIPRPTVNGNASANKSALQNK